MRGGRRMRGQIPKHGASLFHRFVLVELSDHLLRAGLVQTGIEREFAAMLGIIGRWQQGPSGEHLGEAYDVILGVAAAHTQRVQLQNLACNVFVEATGAIDAGDRIRSNRIDVVEIEQHRRMALDGQQHIGEPADNMGPNGLALIGPGHALNLVGRDAEMVGPEPDQPLHKSDLGAESGFGAGPCLVKIDLSPRIRDGFGGDLCRHRIGILLAALHHGGRVRHLLSFRFLLRFRGDDRFGLPLRIGLVDGAESLRTRRQRGCRHLACRRPFEFGDQRPARIRLDRRNRSRPRPHPKPMEGQYCFSLCGTAHDNAPNDTKLRRAADKPTRTASET